MHFAVKALLGFILTPLALALNIPLNSPAPTLFYGAACVLMLFFRRTRAFALGAILFVGAAILLLLAICGRSGF